MGLPDGVLPEVFLRFAENGLGGSTQSHLEEHRARLAEKEDSPPHHWLKIAAGLSGLLAAN
jgi:hypothetical protein